VEIPDLLIMGMFATFMGLLLAGLPVAFCLWGSAMLFAGVGYVADVYLGTSTDVGFNFLGLAVRRIYGAMANGILVAVPMFVFMGLMLERSGMAQKLMSSSQNLFGKMRGGLAVTTILIGVLLSASTGIIGASVVLLGTLSLPSMLRQGYSKELAGGTVAASGTLGILIPPSIMLVIMADQLGLSVGDLFMGAVIPGLLLGTLYVVFIIAFAYFRPKVAPPSVEFKPLSWQAILSVLKDVFPAAFLILTVLGSIFAGVATVTEASGVGALAAALLALINRRLKFQVLKEVLLGTFQTVGFIFAIIVGATCFSLVMRGLGGDDVIQRILSGLPFGPHGIVFSILVCVFILGFFLDWIEVTLIILPLVGPAVAGLDITIDGHGVIEKPVLVWFAMLIAINLQTSFLTPPVGPALFYLQGVCPPEMTLGHLYRGVLPFVMIQLVGLLIVFFWPSLVIWLPITVYR